MITMREPITPGMTLQHIVEKLIKRYLRDGTQFAVSQVATEATVDEGSTRKIVVRLDFSVTEHDDWPALLPSSGIDGQPRMQDLERPKEWRLLKRFVDLCEAGDVDESTEALGWGNLIRETKSLLESKEKPNDGQ